MLNLWTAIIVAVAAILSSTLTSSLTHLFARRRHKREKELQWLEERFRPALDFLGRVYAIISNAPKTKEGRKQIVDEIHNIVVGPSKEINAWCIAVLLDPEDTGLRDHIFSAMTYAHIIKSEKELINYQSRLHLSLNALAEEFRKERQGIVAGRSLESLIRERKVDLERATSKFGDAVLVLKAFLRGDLNLNIALKKLKSTGIRNIRLDWAIKIAADGVSQKDYATLNEVRSVCKEKGWLRNPNTTKED